MLFLFGYKFFPYLLFITYIILFELHKKVNDFACLFVEYSCSFLYKIFNLFAKICIFLFSI